MKLRLLPMLLCAFFLIGAADAAELTILHTSEHHGTVQPIEDGPYKGLGGVARRAALIEKIRREAKNVLLVDSGDLVIGTAMSSVFRGAPDIAAMSLMRYDAQALGNHDFDFGLAHLRELKTSARFPFLCTNLKPKRPGICEPYVIKSVGGLRIGIIGLLGGKTFPDFFEASVVKELDAREPLGAARDAVAALKGRVDLIVAVTHEETEEDLALLESVAGIDVIVGGHTPGFDGFIPRGGKAPIRGRAVTTGPVFVKSHQQARTLGRLDLTIDRGIRSAEAVNIPVDASIPEEPKVAALVADYARRLETETNRVVGRTQVDLEGESEAVRTRETNFGDLLAEMMRKQTGADVAFVNGGAIRGTIPAGQVTFKQVMRTLPYNDSLVTVKLNGAELRETLENSVSRIPEAGRFLQVAGLSFVFDAAAPAGARVKDIRVGGAPVNTERDYAVAVNSFVANGGDGFALFPQARGRAEHQTMLRDLLAKALESAPVDIRTDGRIRAEGAATPPGDPHAHH
jgi:5'-nucleotidase / UDP-sugar diphosphatase